MRETCGEREKEEGMEEDGRKREERREKREERKREERECVCVRVCVVCERREGGGGG